MSTKVLASLALLALAISPAVYAAAPTIASVAFAGASLQLTVHSDVGITNQVLCSTNLNSSSWTTLTNLLVIQSPWSFADTGAAPAPRRFYRVIAQYPASNPPPAGTALIPAGLFQMGDSFNDAGPDEHPVHAVYVGAFYLETNLVSKSLWDGVLQWATNHGYSFDNLGAGKAVSHPVQMINWYDAVKWCNARSELEGLTPCYHTNAQLTGVYCSGQVSLSNSFVNWSADGYRLPTEAEWEKASRGGSNTNRFPWGDLITQTNANYLSDAPKPSYDVNPTLGYHPDYATGDQPYTSPVGSFPPNAYGLYDMAGNVWQWCWDWLDGGYYAVSPTIDPRGPDGSQYRVLRGGSWASRADGERCSMRFLEGPAGAYNQFGFRCARSN